MKNSRDWPATSFPVKFGRRSRRTIHRSVTVLATLLLAIGTAATAAAAGPAPQAGGPAPQAGAPAPQAAVAAAPAGTGATGHDYATDVFADPWDYANSDDLLLDGGPSMSAVNAAVSGGLAVMRLSDNGYVSPIWGGYDGSLLIGRDGAKPGNALDSSSYRTVAFQAYSDRDVAAGLIWFNCPGGGVASSCGGGASFLLKAGWNTYVISPGASVFQRYPLSWGGSINGLRLAVSPGAAGTGFALDWFRVVAPHSGATATWSNPAGGGADVVWDADGNDADNTTAQLNWGVLGHVSGTSGSVDLSVLPAGSYRIGVRTSQGFSGWQAITLAAPLPRFVTPNAVGDRDYATTVLNDPWDMNSAGDVAAIGNATNVSYAGDQLAATNTSNDPYVNVRLAAGGFDSRVYRNLTVTSAYDGPFDLQDIAGGGTMARVMWGRQDGATGQTNDVLTYSGSRAVTIDLGMPTDQLVEPDTTSAAFLSGSPVTTLRWDPNEDRGARRWYLQDVQLRSDFATTGSFPIVWNDGAYQPGGTATLIADTDRSGCNGTTVASGVPVNQGANTTVWDTSGVPHGRYWLCLTITRGTAVSSSYAGGVLVVGTNPPGADPNPVGTFDTGALSGHTYWFAGWAFDPDAPGQPINVDVYDLRPDGTQVGTRYSTGVSRPDVAAAYPGVGGSTGFTGSVHLTGAGRHTVCFFAINVGPGTNRLFSCGAVDVSGPLGAMDAVTSNGQSTLRVAGWASDPDAGGAAEAVHLYVYGPDGSVAGTATQTFAPRPDVQRVYPWSGPNTGFVETVPVSAAGVNRVCGFAINVAPPSTNPLIGCRDLLVQNAFGSLDGAGVAGRTIWTGGWALNPNHPSGPVTVHVYDFGPAGLAAPPLQAKAFQADSSRPDVAAVYPGYASNHGFSTSMPAVGAGKHTECVFAITTDGGVGNPLLGCRDVIVP
ncbi:MAG TPA: hypothetical protein VIJ00_15605 [Nakamurella sp.]